VTNLKVKKRREFLRNLERINRELEAEVERMENLLASGIHTCNPTCKRPLCVLRRENRVLREALGLAEGWTITYNPKPIPTRDDDWDYIHEDYDGENGLCGTAGSYLEAVQQILGRE
jgi:hypothetical protein